jgi:5,10-methylenetetrahydromethanopterin reductase
VRNIRIGLGVADAGRTPLAELLAQMRSAEEAGFQSVWIPNIFGMDALCLAALAGRETSRIELGTAVLPTHSRHPFYAAQQAATAQAACDGRFVLGLGPSHKVVIENMLGLSFDKPARHVREYVTVVKELLEKGETHFEGETLRVNATLAVECGSPPPVLIGALGPLMRRIAGGLCDGTITWMTGPRTLAGKVVPGVRAAAEAAGRPAPRIVAGTPVVLTDDPTGARETAGRAFALYGGLPSYRAMLDEEGVEGPADLALIGDEKALEADIRRLAEAGVTDFHAAIFPHGPDGKAAVLRTHAFLGELAGQ